MIQFLPAYLISNMAIQVFGALRMSVKMFLMWNSKMLIDGEGDENVETSLLEASNLIVLKVRCSFLFITSHDIWLIWHQA